MRPSLRFLAPVLLAVALPAAALAAKANVEITNHSDWAIYHFYLSSTDERRWGPDQLGDEVIGSGESFVLRGVPCDSYDVKLVDEHGDQCVVPAVDICGKRQTWTITRDDLLDCERQGS
ncbi:MAG TPA: hypothetical protein VGV61_10190 [Thermoanaerobaculia bacterium]|jgi:hypothetical protein|nr:hypothetical protein [Thermoanaerobaculia bacterium]